MSTMYFEQNHVALLRQRCDHGFSRAALAAESRVRNIIRVTFGEWVRCLLDPMSSRAGCRTSHRTNEESWNGTHSARAGFGTPVWWHGNHGPGPEQGRIDSTPHHPPLQARHLGIGRRQLGIVVCEMPAQATTVSATGRT